LKIKDLRANFTKDLSGIYDNEEILSFFYILSEKELGLKRVDVALHLDRTLSNAEFIQFEEAKKRLHNQEPIQYILGDTYFYGMLFVVNEHVLIPRPETEELVEYIINEHKNSKKGLKILDVGTGSGCIAISLAKNLEKSEVYGVDISTKAIEVAKKNAQKNDVAVTFIKQDILAQEKLFQEFDIIVSNPPYVRELEKEEMKSNVLDNEPHQALFVSDENPLVFYKKITELASTSLKDNGALYFEINQYLGEQTVRMVKEFEFKNIELHKDLFGNDRMVFAYL